MKVLGIIPARYASSRFPGKPLAMIGGKTMIERVYKGCDENTKFYDLVVATDDNRIKQEVERFGGKAIMTASDHINGSSRIAEVVLNNYANDEIDWVINIQGDEPMIHYKLINEIFEALKSKPEADIITMVRKISNIKDGHNPNIVKCVFDLNFKALYFSRSTIPYYRNKSEEIYYQHLGIYAYKPDILTKIISLPESRLESAESLEQLRWLENGFTIYVGITDYLSHGVDVPEDISKIERML